MIDEHSRNKKMTPEKQLQLQVEALRDQMWASLGDSYKNLERILEHGPIRPGDEDLLAAAIHTVLSEIAYREARIIEIEA